MLRPYRVRKQSEAQAKGRFPYISTLSGPEAGEGSGEGGERG